jgi:hypothetical protein
VLIRPSLEEEPEIKVAVGADSMGVDSRYGGNGADFGKGDRSLHLAHGLTFLSKLVVLVNAKLT